MSTEHDPCTQQVSVRGLLQYRISFFMQESQRSAGGSAGSHEDIRGLYRVVVLDNPVSAFTLTLRGQVDLLCTKYLSNLISSPNPSQRSCHRHADQLDFRGLAEIFGWDYGLGDDCAADRGDGIW